MKGLGTTECANIFLAINTEQKPVPRSLVFDLYGVANEQIIDPAATRARDIIIGLHGEEGSPYHDLIKVSSSARKRGGIALSTAVTAIKPMVEEKGDFDQIRITELQAQQQTFLNYFGALADKYGDRWDDKTKCVHVCCGLRGRRRLSETSTGAVLR